MVETRSGKMQDPAQERIQAEESAKPQPGATIGRDASSYPVVLNPNIDIPKYDGTEDPRPWIESLEEIGFLYHWADYIISRYAAMNMTGSAKTWLNLHKASFTSWENIKIRLIQDFSLDANKEELRMKLNRMQHWNEPAIRFAEDILVLCNKVDPAMEEETKIEHVIGGLKKEYSFALYLNPPKTTDDLLVVCKKMDSFEKKYRERVEKSRNLYNGPRYSRPQQQSRYVPPTAARNYQTTSRPQAPVSNNYKNDSPPTPRQYRNNFPQPSTPRRPYNPNFVPKPNLQRNTYNKSQEVSKNRTEDGRPICFKCNKPGHVARYCRVKFIRILEEDPTDTQEKIFRVGRFKLSVAPESVNQSKSTINGIKKLDPKYKLKINVDKIGTFEALVDTGADLSVVDLRTALDTGHGISKLAKICAGPDGKKLDMVGSIFLNIKIDDETLSHNFVILKTHLRTLILGRDFLKKMNAKIDCKQETIKYDLTNNHDEINFEMLKIKSAKDSIVPECSMKLIKALVETEDGEYIIEESSKMFQTNGLRLARSLINVINRETHIWITNPYPRPLKIMKNQTLAFGSSPAKINVSREREVEKNEEPRFQINENLSPKEQKELKQVLERYGDLFSSRLGRTNLAKHRIDTEDAKPIKHKPYRVSAKERDIIKEQIDEMLTEGIIRPSSSPWSFPVILVKKRDGKYRFCVDYRKLNNVTVKDVYPIPRIDEVMDTLQGSTHFSAIDLRSGYWQVEVEERDKEKTAFTTAHGLYEFNVMPFGLCNAPATFERNMENMLGNLRWQICLCYLDDVIIYSPDFPTHLKRLEAVFRCFRESNLRLNDKKCRFAFEELEILGYITSKHGIKPAEHNIKAVRNFPRPKKVKEVQSFLGMCSYYRKFIKDFSKIADPLTNLIKKSVSFTWTERQEEAFQTLKTALLSPPILGHFNPNAPTYVHTDASNIGIGATLVQDIGGEEKVISYLSRTLSKAEQNYSTTEKECLAVVWSMSKLRPYLYGRHFKIVTDHHALCWLKNLKDPTGRLARWALKIQEYDSDIIHKSGKKHLDADGLSRGPLPETDWDEDFERLFLNQITDEEDKFIESVKKNLNGSRRSIAQNFKEEDGCLFKKNPNPEGRAWLLVVPENKKREIMKEYHNHMSNGHLGVARTMYRLKSKYFWPSMLKDVSEFVKTCHLCQSRKGSNQLPSGLLQPIPPANFPFERIGIDFVGPLPSTKNRKKWIIVLTDYYTRYAETRAVSEATVKEVSKFLVEDIFLRHGAPQYLISDRGSQFTSNLMKEVMKTCKIKHCFTTSYHPQTNGLTERLNRTLINMLSMYVNTDQKNWDEILPFITHAYNTTIQETTGYSPFFLMFGREPTSLLDDRNISVDIDKDDYDEYIEHHLDKINRTRKLVINNTIKTQERMKKNYDKKHMERSYEPGELVAVWTPIRKIGKCEKLLRKYFGPYRILKKLSNVNYLIEPKDNPGQDPLIVHVSRLKPYFERIDEVTHEDIYKDLISTIQLVEKLDRYPLRNKRKIDSVEPEETSMNVKTEGTQVSNYVVQHLPRNPSIFSEENGEDLQKWLKGYERVARYKISFSSLFTTFGRLEFHLQQMRKGILAVARKAGIRLSSREPKIDTIEGLVKEEIGRTLAPISKSRRSPQQKEISRQFFNTRYEAQTIRPHPELHYRKQGGRRETNEWRTTEGKPICFHCGRPGHVVRYCRDRQRQNEERRNQYYQRRQEPRTFYNAQFDFQEQNDNFEEHLRRLKIVLNCLKKASLCLNAKKSKFGAKTITVLGHENFGQEQMKDPELMKIADKIQQETSNKSFLKIDNTLYKNNYDPMGRIRLLVVPRHLRPKILINFHDLPTAGHLGFTKTYDRIRKKLYWPGMYRNVRSYVAHCQDCQQRKRQPQFPTGHLQPIPVPRAAFEKIGMDFLGRFPTSTCGYRWIIVCTDYLTKYAINKALPTSESMEVAKFLVEDVILKHGAPRELITDRGRNFTSSLIRDLNNHCRIIHRTTTAYHPQTNGLTERLIKTMADMLSMYVDVNHKDWNMILPFVTFAYNTARQESTGFTPFFLAHGREAETPLDLLFPKLVPEDDDFIQTLGSRAEEARQLAGLHSMRSQQSNKLCYDAHHRNITYQPGDLVWIFIPKKKSGLPSPGSAGAVLGPLPPTVAGLVVYSDGQSGSDDGLHHRQDQLRTALQLEEGATSLLAAGGRRGGTPSDRHRRASARNEQEQICYQHGHGHFEGISQQGA
ncbi:hypothetical protein LAZ67_11002341, partial [Cordylochernes scorpioides]